MKINTIKALLAVVWTGIAVYCRQLAVPVMMLFAVVAADYISGMVCAYLHRELSSKKGVAGILKKLCYFIVIGVGAGVDWLLHTAAEAFSFSYALPFAVGMLVTVWLIINELISILENLEKIGVPLPAFLGKLIARLKVSAEQVTKQTES